MVAEQPMNFSDWASAMQNIIAAAAIIVAGVWAFFRFVKGRTLKHKAELTVAGSLLSGAEKRAISARVHLRNTGLTKTPLDRAFVRVLAMRPRDWESREWKRMVTVRAFEDHDWVEPQEPIGDELLIPLADGETGAGLSTRRGGVLAAKVLAQAGPVVGSPRRGRGATTGDKRTARKE